MTKKINIFTALIFVYSIVVCTVFKKNQEQTLLSTKATENFEFHQGSKIQISSTPKVIIQDQVTASNGVYTQQLN
jgi:hypothetical protein